MPPRPHTRPRLELLEARQAPVFTPTSVSLAGITEAFNFNPFAFQAETVKVNVSATPGSSSGPAVVNTGQVAITDGSQVQVVPVNSGGQASATFSFTLFQGLWLPHPVTATYFDFSGTFAGSATSVQSPDATNQALPFLAGDALAVYAVYAFTVAYVSALAGG